MAESRPVSPDRLPTLTDVLEANSPSLAAADAAPVVHPVAHLVEGPVPAEELLACIQERIDTMFQARLREAIAPALARAVDGLLREIGPELASALRETTERAVAQELARRRRGP
jgi:hypothetical protein